jgi:hypothetical protein
VFKPSERLLLNYNKEEEALLGKVPVPPPHFALFNLFRSIFIFKNIKYKIKCFCRRRRALWT